MESRITLLSFRNIRITLTHLFDHAFQGETVLRRQGLLVEFAKFFVCGGGNHIPLVRNNMLHFFLDSLVKITYMSKRFHQVALQSQETLHS
jgi:hypothetical protein